MVALDPYRGYVSVRRLLRRAADHHTDCSRVRRSPATGSGTAPRGLADVVPLSPAVDFGHLARGTLCSYHPSYGAGSLLAIFLPQDRSAAVPEQHQDAT